VNGKDSPNFGLLVDSLGLPAREHCKPLVFICLNDYLCRDSRTAWSNLAISYPSSGEFFSWQHSSSFGFTKLPLGHNYSYDRKAAFTGAAGFTYTL